MIGDVCGQGAVAARATAMARAAVRTAAHSRPEPVRVLSVVNEVLHLWFGVRRSSVTAVYATLRPPVGSGTGAAWSVSVASGGHPPGFVLRSVSVSVSVSEAAFAHGGRIATDDAGVVVVRIAPRP